MTRTAFALALCVLAAAAARAEARRILGLGAFAGYSNARDAGTALHYGGELSLRPFAIFETRIEISYRSEGLEGRAEGFRPSRLEAIPVSLSGRLFLLGERSSAVVPFLEGGGGFVVTRLTERLARVQGSVRFRTTRADPSWHAGGGLEWNLGRHLAVAADARWVEVESPAGGADVGGPWISVGLELFP